MQQKVVPLLVPPLRKIQPEEAGVYQTKRRGMEILTTPLLNKGSAFTVEERETLGLNGLLPPVVSTLESQVASAYAQYQRLPDALGNSTLRRRLRKRASTHRQCSIPPVICHWAPPTGALQPTSMVVGITMVHRQEFS